MSWRPAKLRALRPGLHLLETRVEDFDVRAVVVRGSTGTLVWDTLAHPAQMAPALALLEEGPPRVAYSHADWDHVWGTAALPDVAEVVAHERCARRFVEEVPRELAERVAKDPARWGAVALVSPTRTFLSSTVVELGDVRVELHHLPGHTPDCCVAWIPAWGVLLAGDVVEAPVPVVNDASALPAWITALRRWASMPEISLVVPSHGAVAGAEQLVATTDYLEALLEGRAPAPPAGAPAFYRDTHADNVGLVRDDSG